MFYVIFSHVLLKMQALPPKKIIPKDHESLVSQFSNAIDESMSKYTVQAVKRVNDRKTFPQQNPPRAAGGCCLQVYYKCWKNQGQLSMFYAL